MGLISGILVSKGIGEIAPANDVSFRGRSRHPCADFGNRTKSHLTGGNEVKGDSRMKRTAVLLIVVLAVAFSLQCGGGEKPTGGLAEGIAGEWTRTRYSLGQEQLLTLTFNKDGTYKYIITIGEAEHYTEEGTYSVGGDSLKVTH